MSKQSYLSLFLLIIIIAAASFLWYNNQKTVLPDIILPTTHDSGVPNNSGAGADPETDKFGGVYTEAITAPPHLDPNRSASGELTDITVNIYESLYELDANYHPVPALATSCTTSEGGKKYTFTLRRGVRFHDGSALTAEDVLASFEYWLNYGNSADIRNKIVGYGISEKNYLFYIELKEVYAPFVGRLSNYVDNQRLVVMPKEVAVTGNADTLIEIPCGTGPYKFADWIPGQYCRLTRFDDYTPFTEVASSGASGQKTAYFDEIVFKFTDIGDSRLAALKAGEIAYAGKITPDDYEALADDPDVRVVLGPLKEQNMFVFNSGVPPFNNVNARLAVMAGLDIKEMAEIAVSKNSVYWALESSLFGSGSAWAVAEAGQGVYNSHDLIKARAYLEAAKYDGSPVLLLVNSQDPTEFMATQILQNQLEEIGFTTKLISLDPAAQSEISSQPAGWNINTATLNTTYYDPLAYAGLINQDSWITHWHDADAQKMQGLYARLARETDTAKRFSLVREWNELFYRSAPAIKSFSYKLAYLFSPSVEALWLNQLGVIPEGLGYNAWFKKIAATTVTVDQ